MAFHTNSININLRNRHTLSCRCERPNGSWSYSQLDLNCCLGNNNGEFIWGGDSFAHSATEIRLSLEGPEKAPWLHAELNDHHGTHQCASVNLSECIHNHIGVLTFKHCVGDSQSNPGDGKIAASGRHRGPE